MECKLPFTKPQMFPLYANHIYTPAWLRGHTGRPPPFPAPTPRMGSPAPPPPCSLWPALCPPTPITQAAAQGEGAPCRVPAWPPTTVSLGPWKQGLSEQLSDCRGRLPRPHGNPSAADRTTNEHGPRPHLAGSPMHSPHVTPTFMSHRHGHTQQRSTQSTLAAAQSA